MTHYRIEKNIPIPARKRNHGSQLLELLKVMKVGDSFMCKRTQYCYALVIKKRYNINVKLTCRQLSRNIVRVWRAA